MLLVQVLLLASSAIAAKTAGCGKKSSITDGSTITVNTASGPRTALVYLPPKYSSKNPSPLIVSFHGYTSNSEGSAEETQYNNPDVNSKYVAIFPQGDPASAPTWQGMNPDSGVDDIAFIDKLLDRVSQGLCLDDSHFYASGFSNGGGFTNAIACGPGLGPRFSAFGINSGAFWAGSENLDGKAPACNPNRKKTPIFEVHGDADPTIVYSGGVNGGESYQGIQHWLKAWAGRNECPHPQNPKSQNKGSYTRYSYPGGCNTQHFKVAGLDHEWWQPGDGAIGSSAAFLNFFDNN